MNNIEKLVLNEVAIAMGTATIVTHLVGPMSPGGATSPLAIAIARVQK